MTCGWWNRWLTKWWGNLWQYSQNNVCCCQQMYYIDTLWLEMPFFITLISVFHYQHLPKYMWLGTCSNFSVISIGYVYIQKSLTSIVRGLIAALHLVQDTIIPDEQSQAHAEHDAEEHKVRTLGGRHTNCGLTTARVKCRPFVKMLCRWSLIPVRRLRAIANSEHSDLRTFAYCDVTI